MAADQRWFIGNAWLVPNIGEPEFQRYWCTDIHFILDPLRRWTFWRLVNLE